MCKAIFPDIVSFLFLFCCMETRKCAFSYNNDNSCNDDDDDDHSGGSVAKWLQRRI